MRTLDDIPDQLRDLQPSLICRYPIRSMGVFGSYARGEQGEGSDLDRLVELGDDLDLLAYVGLQMELSDALGVPVEREALRPRLASKVLAEVVPL
jgi:predicted nucleotidyltransferase